MNTKSPKSTHRESWISFRAKPEDQEAIAKLYAYLKESKLWPTRADAVRFALDLAVRHLDTAH